MEQGTVYPWRHALLVENAALAAAVAARDSVIDTLRRDLDAMTREAAIAAAQRDKCRDQLTAVVNVLMGDKS